MTDTYRDWHHPDGDLPEQAPEGLVDIYTAPWLVQRAGETPGAAPDGSPTWPLVVVAALLALLVLGGWWAWRHRGALRLWMRLSRLERRASRPLDAGARRALLDELVAAIGEWQHGGRAPWRDRLETPWSGWVSEIDHGRFGRTSDESGTGKAELVDRLRAMRRELRRGASA